MPPQKRRSLAAGVKKKWTPGTFRGWKDARRETCEHPQDQEETTDTPMSGNTYYKKKMESNRLINEESNRIITWSLAIIGGTILVVISTGYVNPSGFILYAYALFAIGWVYLAMSIYHGEALTRMYIAGFDKDEEDKEGIHDVGKRIDKSFARQISYFKYGIFVFAIWLVLFLVWFIVYKN